MDTTHKISPEDVRAQYSALSSYFNTVVTFRFTVIGLYLTAVGLIISSSPSIDKSVLILLISVTTFLLELRNRSLYQNLAECGMKTEKNYFGYDGPRSKDPFFSHMMEGWNYPWIFKSSPLKIKFISHTFAINLLYLVISAYSIYTLVRQIWFP